MTRTTVGEAAGSTRISPGASPGLDRRFQLFFDLLFLFFAMACKHLSGSIQKPCRLEY
jgi:hypothetical protein